MKRIIKPYTIVIVAILTTAFCHTSKNLQKHIKSNYFDLPSERLIDLQNKLQTDSVAVLSNQSTAILGNYLSQKVLETPDSNSIDIRGNYFWNIYNALPSFVSANERHTGYNQGARDYSDNEQLMAYAIYRIDRSPENLRRIFEIFKPSLTQLVSSNTYNDMGVRQYVVQAISSYEEISQISNFKTLLQNAYTQVDTTTGSFAWEGTQQSFRKFENSAYGFSVDEVNQIIAKHLELERYSDMAYSPWLSFWMRRNHENNMDEVLKILNEIDSIYSSQ